MNKAKNDHMPRRSLRKRIFMFVAIAMLALVGGVVVLISAVMFALEFTSSGEFVAELPTELVPTAEYLLAHPMPTPGYLNIETPIDWENGTQTRLCVLTNASTGFGAARLFINGSRLPRELVRSYPLWLEPNDDFGLGMNVTSVCANLPLNHGLHLIEIQPSVLESLPLHRWAIEVK